MNKFIVSLLLCIFSITCFSQDYTKLIKDAGEDFPGANYVTIFDSTSVFMETSGLSYYHTHYLTKILDNKGAREFSVVKVDYDPLSAYVEINEVKVYRKNGEVETITNPVLDYVAPARMIYWGASQKMVEVGYLEPGDAVEVKSFKKGYTYALLQGDDDDKYIPPMRGNYYDIVHFWSAQPIITKVYTLNILKEKYLQYKVYNGVLKEAVKDDPDNSLRKVYTFTMNDIKPLKTPAATVAKSDIETKLLLSTSKDWEAKSRWFYNVNEEYGSFDPTPELQAFVNDLLIPAKDETDSISILTHWVADNMRYSGISMGPGEGYTLHNADMNFTDRCGVCKDKASLLIAMLRAAGFESYAAMTMAGERIDRIPADQFNHSVSVVKRRNGQFELLDPTWVPNIRELWSSAEQQQNYLIGTAEGCDLMETPISAPENHYIFMTAVSEITDEGTLICDIHIIAEGQTDAAVRGIFSSRYSEWENNVESEILRIDPRAEIIAVTHTDSERYLEQPVELVYQIKIPNYATVTDKEIIFVPFLANNIFRRAMPHLNYDTSLESREYAFRDRCSRLVDIREKIILPKYSKVIYLPKEKNVSSDYINYAGKYDINKNELTFTQTASLGKRIYEANEWTSFKNLVDAQNGYANDAIILKK
ncbi:DUF3857 and transglutaminase domain-containing protein [Bacteroidales bacterium OttesenSCG-928-K03]|nr:DUF3857 and transglutaminase domain-containing protein [Bacteroidales bacterium OttesenSCG-928-L14]MDL2242119.1 DUF3857 and transglutaminase domain-containing protein [Bacteroidales bacterium OttesenSCG-928-K03]